MKPFDLDRAIAGDPLVTRDGRPVTDFHFHSSATGAYTCSAVINGRIHVFQNDGCQSSAGLFLSNDLFMASRKRTVYLNVWRKGPADADCAAVYHDAGVARKAARMDRVPSDIVYVLIAHPIEIEE